MLDVLLRRQENIWRRGRTLWPAQRDREVVRGGYICRTSHRRCNRPPLVFVCLGIFGESVSELSYGE